MPDCLVKDALINYCSHMTYNSAPKAYVYLRSSEEKTDKDICCFYDGYPIKAKSVGLPKKFKSDGTFIVWGHFCSYECARSFVHDNRQSCNQEKELSLLGLIGIKTHGIHFRLQRSPSKFLLEKYGGPLHIEDWRKENTSNRLWVIRTPNIERTFNTYDCYLNHESTKIPQETDKHKNKEETRNTKNVTLNKRATPAHFTKKSLLTLVNKN